MSEVQYVNSPAELDELFKSTSYVVVDFFATWCGPCKAIGPVYEDQAKEYGVEKKLVFAKVDVDAVSELAQKYKVTSMPTFLFFKDGERITVHGQEQIKGANVPALKAVSQELSERAKNDA